MKAYLLVICLFVYAEYVAGQTPQTSASQKDLGKIDSLRSLLSSARGVDRGSFFHKLAFAYLPLNKDSAIALAKKASNIYSETKNDTALFDLTLFFGKRLLEKGENELAFPYYWKAKSMQAEAVRSARYQYKLFTEISAMHYTFLGNYDSALYYDKETLAAARDSVSEGKALVSMGLSYNALGMTVKALDCYLRAMTLLETKGDAGSIGALHNNLGILYEDDGNNEKAELNYKKAYEQYKQSGSLLRQFSALNNLGILYSHQGRYKESLDALYLAEELLPSLNIKKREGVVGLNIGNTLVHMGKPIDALARFEKAMKVFTQVGDNYGIALCHRQMGEAYYKIGQYKKCEQEEQIAMTLARKHGYIYLIQDAHDDLADMYEAARQHEKAHFHLKRYHELKDSLSSRDRASKLGLLEKEYELAKQEEQRKSLEDQQAASIAQARVDRVTKLSLGSGLVFVIGAAVIALVGYRRARAKNALLAAQKEKIVQQSQALEEAAKAKSRFFANVSHELRTPVTLITGMLEVLHGKNNNGHPTLDIALNNSRKLQTLVDEVLDLTRLENTTTQLVLTQKDVGPLLRRILSAFDSLLQKKSISLKYEASGLDGVFTALDEDKFEKIINNLVYNAVKFNREGGQIVVTGKLDDNHDGIIIRVADTGSGIPSEDIPHIFERFYQSANSRQNNVGGVGIGLSLVKEFTQLHRGTVSVESTVGKGSMFEVVLPVVTADKESEELFHNVDDPVINFSHFDKTPVVLLVEDNEEMQLYIKEIFDGNVHMAFANNGSQALQWLNTNSADLIISDVMMPEMDGYELLRRLKGSETLKGIPVVMLTARAAEEDRLHGLSLGVDDYLTKPFSGKELKIRLHNLLTNLQIRRHWQSKPVAPEEEKKEPSEGKEFMEKVEQFVHANIRNVSLGIASLADHLAMSERQLYRKCGLLTGMAPAQLIKELRLKLAYKILTDKDVTKISELASRIGFEDTAYFSRQFLERFGKRPSEML